MGGVLRLDEETNLGGVDRKRRESPLVRHFEDMQEAGYITPSPGRDCPA
jgi:hypothetical protein